MGCSCLGLRCQSRGIGSGEFGLCGGGGREQGGVGLRQAAARQANSSLFPDQPPKPQPPTRHGRPTPHRDSWIKVSRQIYAAAFAAASKQRILSGPDWSNSNMDPQKLQWWLDGVKGTLNQVAVHLYGGDVVTDGSIKDLLAEERMVRGAWGCEGVGWGCVMGGSWVCESLRPAARYLLNALNANQNPAPSTTNKQPVHKPLLKGSQGEKPEAAGQGRKIERQPAAACYRGGHAQLWRCDGN